MIDQIKEAYKIVVHSHKNAFSEKKLEMGMKNK